MKPFHEQLTAAIHRIRRYGGKKVGQIEDELAQAIGRKGRHSIEYWRKEGNTPYQIEDLENLTQALIARQGLPSQEGVKQFLRAGHHPEPERTGDRLWHRLGEMPANGPPAAGPEMRRRLLRWLPLPTFDTLFGADVCMEQLLTYLLAREQHHIISIYGIGGIGKTALANHAVRQVIQESHHFADVIWVSAKQSHVTPFGILGDDAPVKLETIFDDIGRLLGLTDVVRWPIPRKIEELAVELRRCPYLIIIDNLETISDYQHLVPWLVKLAGPTKFLLTSRCVPNTLERVTDFPLNELDPSPAETLMQHIADQKEVGAFDKQAVYRLVGGNPLAIILTISQMQYLSPQVVLEQIKLGGVEELYSYIYQKSWSLLTEPAREMLMTIRRAGDEAEWAWLIDMLNWEVTTLREVLHHLLSLSLVYPQHNQQNEPCYAIHRLTSTFLRTEVLGWK